MALQPVRQTTARPQLSRRQADILAFISERISMVGYPPTIREICTHFSISSTNGVSDHIKALTRKGYLTHQESKSRTLRPIDFDGATSPMQPRTPTQLHPRQSKHQATITLPLLGRVAAGMPILAPEEARPEDSLVIDSSLLGCGQDTFALEVVGDSMVEAGILDGDLVFVRRRDYAESGDIAVVMIDNEATLKRYFLEESRGRVRLQPANSAMAPIFIYPNEAQRVDVVGVVVGVYRRL